MIRAALIAATLICAPLMATADAAFTRLYDVLQLDAYIDITRQEGLEDFGPLAQDMLGQSPDAVTQKQVQSIYDVTRLRDVAQGTMKPKLAETDVAGALAVMQSDMGARVIELELAARRAMSDPDIERSARLAWAIAQEEKPWLVARIQELIAASDLIDRNVSGALNSNLRFYQGLADGGALNLSETEMLAEVWAQEEAIRADTEDWLGAYLLLAYQPLDEDDITRLITFWQTPPGKALNAALFAGFNQMYDDISYATARVLALRMGTQEL